MLFGLPDRLFLRCETGFSALRKSLFRTTEEPFRQCRMGFSARRYGLFRAGLECGRAFSGIVVGSRRNVYAVFIRSSASFRFCFEKKRCQNILLPVCINIHSRSAAMSARAGFFLRHMACCLRRGGDGGAMRESFIKRPILLF